MVRASKSVGNKDVKALFVPEKQTNQTIFQKLQRGILKVVLKNPYDHFTRVVFLNF
jgi:hypothetical protein